MKEINRNEWLQKLQNLQNVGVDFDGYFGYQCVDLIMYMVNEFTGFNTWGNAIDYLYNELPQGFERFTPNETQVQSGDILVWQWSESDEYGHIGCCMNYDTETGIITSLEQNVDGNTDNLEVGGVARIVSRDSTYLVGIIRPNFKDDESTDIEDNQHLIFIEQPQKATVIANTLNIRNLPRVDGLKLGVYDYGSTLIYDSYIIVNGNVWISYIANSGNRVYLASYFNNETYVIDTDE